MIPEPYDDDDHLNKPCPWCGEIHEPWECPNEPEPDEDRMKEQQYGREQQD